LDNTYRKTLHGQVTQELITKIGRYEIVKSSYRLFDFQIFPMLIYDFGP